MQGFDYTGMVDNAMRGVVRDVLRQVLAQGLVDPHHFFITFRTDHAGVTISENLRSKYPHEITIVLQHQFRELKVEQDCFRVVLSFNNIPEKLVVPYSALTGFADPSVKFGLQFHASEEEDDDADELLLSPQASSISLAPAAAATDKESAKVITLDAFRKK